MKILLFYAVVVAFIGGFIFIILKKLDIEVFGNTVLPKEEWANILPGKWDFKARQNGLRKIQVFKGEMEYYPDGVFKKYVSVKTYSIQNRNETVKEINSYLSMEAGGSYSGKWVLGKGLFWTEIAEKCSMKVAFKRPNYKANFDPCTWFSEKDSMSFGTIFTDDYKMEIKIISKNKILIKGKVFSSDSNVEWIFRKTD